MGLNPVEQTEIAVEEGIAVETPPELAPAPEPEPAEPTDDSTDQEDTWDDEPDLLTALSTLGKSLEAQIDRRFDRLEKRGKGRRKRQAPDPLPSASDSPPEVTVEETATPPEEPETPADPVEAAPPSPSRRRRLTW